jgi:DNA replication protein DnaC
MATITRLRHDLKVTDTDPSAAAPNARLDDDLFEPPAIPRPELGQTIPNGNPCPLCGMERDSLIYNPFVQKSRRTGGWVRHTSRICACPGSDPAAHFPPPPPRPLYDQRWLDREFGQEATRRQTLLTFDLAAQPRLKAMHAAAQGWALRFQEGDRLKGLWFVGPAGIGKGHLASAAANAARSCGQPVLSITPPHLFDLILTDYREEAEEHDRRKRRRQAVRAVPVLALRGLFLAPMLPAELKELDLLLQHREERGLATHVTSPIGPSLVRSRASANPDLYQAIAARLARMTEPPLIVAADTQPYRPSHAAGAPRIQG